VMTRIKGICDDCDGPECESCGGHPDKSDFLQGFCCRERNSLSSPFIMGDLACATDGHIAIRIPRIDAISITRESPLKEAATSLTWEPVIKGKWVDLPPYKLPDKVKCVVCQGVGEIDTCPECDGEGHVELESDYNYYECDCKMCNCEGTLPGQDKVCHGCDGDGLMYSESFMKIQFDDYGLDAFLLEKIKDLPGVKLFSRRDKDKYFYFRFDGGHGIIMGMRG